MFLQLYVDNMAVYLSNDMEAVQVLQNAMHSNMFLYTDHFM
jgi:hypothetical protein